MYNILNESAYHGFVIKLAIKVAQNYVDMASPEKLKR